MNTFEHLPRPNPAIPRHFVPATFDPGSPLAVREMYEALAQRELPADAQILRAWILDWSELESIIAEESSRRYISMTCDTTDTTAAQAFEEFVAQIEPILSEQSDRLKRKMATHPTLSALEPEFGNWFRQVRIALELFRPENIPLETQINLEVQAYQKITGAMSVEYQGTTKTLQQMSPYMQSPERNVREEAWKLVSKRRLRDREALDAAFDKLFGLRMQVARNTGHTNYLDYIFKAKGRFDYTPADCYAFHESIEKLVLPLQRELNKRRAKLMGLPALRPWDMDGDALGRPALKPFTKGDELIAKSEKLFQRLHPQHGTWFSELRARKLIDPDSRLGKAPGGYQIGLDESRVPFIFMNAAGTNGDLYTLLHEAGHAFHQFAMADQPIVAFRDIPSEFAEVASMGMELLASSDLSDFYSPADAKRSRIDELSDIFRLFPWIAMVDSFQHELYSRPNHGASERKEIWLSIMDRFDAGVDWSGLEDARAYQWQKQLHIFEVPFYYVEYGIAQLGALQVWDNARKDLRKAIDQLIAAERLGNSRPLPELFQTAGIRFDFSTRTMEPLIQGVWDELEKLDRN